MSDAELIQYRVKQLEAQIHELTNDIRELKKTMSRATYMLLGAIAFVNVALPFITQIVELAE